MTQSSIHRIDLAIASRIAGLFVVHGSTGTGKTSLAHEVARHASILHGRMITVLEGASLSPRMRPEALTAMLLRGKRDPHVIIFGEILEQVDAERAIHMAKSMLVVAEMHDARLERVKERLVWLGSDEREVDEVMIGQASLDYCDAVSSSEANGGTRTPWFTKPGRDGRRVTISISTPTDEYAGAPT